MAQKILTSLVSSGNGSIKGVWDLVNRGKKIAFLGCGCEGLFWNKILSGYGH